MNLLMIGGDFVPVSAVSRIGVRSDEKSASRITLNIWVGGYVYTVSFDYESEARQALCRVANFLREADTGAVLPVETSTLGANL